MQLLHLIDVASARAFVPDGLGVVSVLPGKTVGGLYAAAYEHDSVLEYNELIVVPALTRYAGRLGFWVSHIYVDNPASAAGGRAIWGLPKQMARFSWTEEGPTCTARVWRGGRLLCAIRSRRRLRLWRQPARLPALSVRGARVLRTEGVVTARVHLASGRARVPPASPFAALGLGRTLLAAHLCPMRLTARAPQPIGRPLTRGR